MKVKISYDLNNSKKGDIWDIEDREANYLINMKLAKEYNENDIDFVLEDLLNEIRRTTKDS